MNQTRRFIVALFASSHQDGTSGACYDWAVCHFVWALIRARNNRLRNLGIVPLLLCLAFCLSASSASFTIWSRTSPIVSLVILSFYFAGLWQLNFARKKNFVNLTWDCIIGNPINELSQIKVVCNHSYPIIYPPISLFRFHKRPQKRGEGILVSLTRNHCCNSCY